MRLDAVPDRNIVRRTIDPEDPLDAVCRLCLERIKSDCHLIHPVWPAPEVPSAKDIEEVFGVVVSVLIRDTFLCHVVVDRFT